MDMLDVLKNRCDNENFEKLRLLNNPKLYDFIGRFVLLCNPKSIFVRNDSHTDADYIRKKSLELGEEISLKTPGHTAHFDGPKDQARDKKNTKFLVFGNIKFGPDINAIERNEGLAEIDGLLKDIMKDKQMYILFLSLGPIDSVFSIYAVQITDSAYVAHSEDILYRPAYEIFKKRGPDIEFFKYVHSAGELINNVSKNIDKRRIYIDIADSIVYSINTQYAGNTVGLKKLSLRLAIRKADREGWLAEHMFIMKVFGPKNRETYFTGAFPSFCGKTSTCMVEGEAVVGDDIAYLKKLSGTVKAVNVERGIFGIIKDINPKDDLLIWKVLTEPGEVIFSNVLIKDGLPYWQGDQRAIPESGINFSGEWHKDKKDENSQTIPHSHPNARYTIRLKDLKNSDPALEDKEGVEIKGIIYGGRDSDTWPPVFESFDWIHGVVTIGCSLESETTAATIGQVGIRKFNLMANLDFLSIPVGKYIKNHLEFVKELNRPPIIFGVNYFQKDEQGNFITSKQDKRVWLKWMELRVNENVDTISTPIGYLPRYEELKYLFNSVLNRDYSLQDYLTQFTIRVPENIFKMERIYNIYKKIPEGIPDIVFQTLLDQKDRLIEARSKFGDYIRPTTFVSCNIKDAELS